jgi:hypothetical protein
MKNLISVGTLEAASNHGQDGSTVRHTISATEILASVVRDTMQRFNWAIAQDAKQSGIPDMPPLTADFAL